MMPTMNNQYAPNPYMQYSQPFQQNPYAMERLNNLQQFQQSLQPVQPQQIQPGYLNGKVVDSLDVVKATDIPMDGNLYYFPKADGTEIYAKNWNLNNGTTRILTFKPILEDNPNNLSVETPKFDYGAMETILDTLLTRFDNLENCFKEMEQSWINLELTSTKSSTKTVNSRTKKEYEE